MALTHHDDITLMIGDEWLITGNLLDESGEPIDLLGSGTEIEWAIINSDGDRPDGADDAATIEPEADGFVRIVVSDSFTGTLEPGRYMNSVRVWVDDEPATYWTGIILAEADPFFVEPIEPELLPPPPALLPGVTIGEPPDDGLPYVRVAGAWVPLPPDLTLPEPPDDGEPYVRRAGAWAPLPSGFSTRFEFQFDDALAPPPNNSQLRLDNADAALTTRIWMHNNDADGLDMSNLLTLIEEGFVVFVQDKDEPLRRHRFHATGPMVNMGSYCEVPVVAVNNGDPLRNNQRCFVMVYGGG